MREVTQSLGLPASTLRYWESCFEQLSPRKDGHGNRYYSPDDIATIRQIQYIRDEMHITRIVAIRTELAKGTRRVDMRERVANILHKVRNELIDIKANL